MGLFDIEDAKERNTTTRILELYTEDQLYSFYCPDFYLGDIRSPFRPDDSNPSFGFYEARDGRICWKDSAQGDKGGVFKFIEKTYAMRGFKGTFQELLDRIATDMGTGETDYVPLIHGDAPKKRPTAKRKQVRIEIEQTLEGTIPPVFLKKCWEEPYGITGNILDAYNAGFAEAVWLYKTVDGVETQMLWGRSTIDNPIFFYHFPHSGHVKCYRPWETVKSRKWIMNCNNTTDVQGLAQCNIERRRPRLLVITKSMKDVMFLRLFGIDAIAFHGEGHIDSISVDFMNYLKAHCGLIITLYDNDMAGIRGAIKMRNAFGIPPYIIPRAYGAKDTTDLYLLEKDRFFILMELLNNILQHEHSDKYTGIGPAAFPGLRAA